MTKQLSMIDALFAHYPPKKASSISATVENSKFNWSLPKMVENQDSGSKNEFKMLESKFLSFSPSFRHFFRVFLRAQSFLSTIFGQFLVETEGLLGPEIANLGWEISHPRERNFWPGPFNVKVWISIKKYVLKGVWTSAGLLKLRMASSSPYRPRHGVYPP